jgi:hypothetical protein
MYYSYVDIEYVARSFSPARTDLALKLLNKQGAPQNITTQTMVTSEIRVFTRILMRRDSPLALVALEHIIR